VLLDLYWKTLFNYTKNNIYLFKVIFVGWFPQIQEEKNQDQTQATTPARKIIL
jgi:hypothetical protein